METLRAIVMYTAVTAMLVKFAVGADHTVGAPSGSWDLTTDLNTWATSQKFSVGDNLIFQYTPLHTVLQVSKADYDACVTDTPIQSFVGGTTTILLSTAVKIYFICGTGGHCGQGMKVEINTVAASTTPPPSPPTTTSPPPSTLSPPSPVEPPPSIPSPLPPSTPSPASSPKKSPTSSTGPSMIPSESPDFPPVTLPPPATQNNGHLQVKPAMGIGFGMMMLLAL